MTPRARVGFLACQTTLPVSPNRRSDAFEHDLQVAALRPALAAHGLGMVELDWAGPMESFDGIELVVVGTSWDYQDRKEEFLARLDAFEARGIVVCNSAQVVRWNVEKTYLRELAQAGAPTIPTLWTDQAGPQDIAAAFSTFDADRVVIKRQVGAGALGQEIFSRDDPPADDWRFDRAAMIQPFQRSIQTEGEYSLLFVDGQFSHAILKRATDGEYRIQSMFGGTEEAFQPSAPDLAAATQVIAMLPFAAPLYARVDMLRLDDGTLAVIEVEMIEPYLYPEQGPQLGKRLAAGIARRMDEMAEAGN